MRKVQGMIILVVLSAFMGCVIGIKAACAQQDGSLDVTFGDHGTVITPVAEANAEARGVVVLPCGDIVAGGVGQSISTQNDFALARYTPYGTLNSRFGMNGVVLTDFGTVLTQAGVPVVNNPSSEQIFALALQQNCDGCNEVCDNGCDDACGDNCKIVAGGESDALGVFSLAVARYNCDGTLDTSFGINNSGIFILPMGSSQSVATAIAIQENNKIVIAGAVLNSDGSSDFLVVRLNCDGTLDRTFGCDRSGIVTIDFGGSEEAAGAVKIQKDGKIVVAGVSNARGSRDFAMARLTRDGKLDVTFGDKNSDGFGRTGRVLTDFSGNNISTDDARAIVLTEACDTCCNINDVAIVLVGFSSINRVSRFALAGYTANGSLDTNFGSDGLVTTVFDGSRNSQAFAAVLEHTCAESCKIVAGGVVVLSNGSANFALARYTLDGNLDEDFGNGGMVVTDVGNGEDDFINALALQGDGDIIAAGQVVRPGDFNNSFALARYNVCDPCCTLCGLQCATCTPCP